MNPGSHIHALVAAFVCAREFLSLLRSLALSLSLSLSLLSLSLPPSLSSLSVAAQQHVAYPLQRPPKVISASWCSEERGEGAKAQRDARLYQGEINCDTFPVSVEPRVSIVSDKSDLPIATSLTDITTNVVLYRKKKTNENRLQQLLW